MAQLLYAHCHAPIPRLPFKLAEYQILIDRLLAKDPANRYQSAHEMLGSEPA